MSQGHLGLPCDLTDDMRQWYGCSCGRDQYTQGDETGGQGVPILKGARWGRGGAGSSLAPLSRPPPHQDFVTVFPIFLTVDFAVYSNYIQREFQFKLFFSFTRMMPFLWWYALSPYFCRPPPPPPSSLPTFRRPLVHHTLWVNRSLARAGEFTFRSDKFEVTARKEGAGWHSAN